MQIIVTTTSSGLGAATTAPTSASRRWDLIDLMFLCEDFIVLLLSRCTPASITSLTPWTRSSWCWVRGLLSFKVCSSHRSKRVSLNASCYMPIESEASSSLNVQRTLSPRCGGWTSPQSTSGGATRWSGRGGWAAFWTRISCSSTSTRASHTR